MSVPITIPVTIASGASLSAAIDLKDYSYRLVGIQMPSAWTTAGLSFQASVDGSTFQEVFSGGSAYSIAALVSQYVIVPVNDFAGIQVFKVRSGTSGTPVAQGADRILYLVLQKLRP